MGYPSWSSRDAGPTSEDLTSIHCQLICIGDKLNRAAYGAKEKLAFGTD